MNKKNVLNEKVLLLSKAYLPLGIISARHSFLLTIRDKAEVITYLPDTYAHSVTKKHPVPSIIRVKNNKNITRKVALCKENLFIRDEYVCQYCGDKLNNKSITIDHILPKSRNGKNTWENLCCCCYTCNNFKGDRTPQEAKMVLLSKPRELYFLKVFIMNIKNDMREDWEPYLFINKKNKVKYAEIIKEEEFFKNVKMG